MLAPKRYFAVFHPSIPEIHSMKAPYIPHRFLLVSAAVAATGLAVSAGADTYFFKGITDYASFSDPDNWLVGGPDGTAATTIPGTGDTLYTLTPIYADMGGGDYSVGKWGFSADWDHSPKPLNVRNGTLRIVNDLTTHNGRLVLSDGGNIYVEGTYIPAIWDGAAHIVEVNAGCDYRITGSYQLYKTQVSVLSGGAFLFAPPSGSFSVYGTSAQNSYYEIYGTMDAPKGVKWSSGNFANSNNNIDFRLFDGGLMRLGSGFSRTTSTGILKLTWNGGTLAATGTVSFVNTDASIADNASVTLDIAEGASVDLSGLTVGTGVYINKSGAGDLAFCAGHMPDTLYVSEGAVSLDAANTSYDLSGITYSSNGKVKINAIGVTITGWNNSLLTVGNFVSGIAAPVVGSTLLTCTDASVLARAKAGLDASLPDGFAVTISGNDLVVSSAYVFDSTTVTDLNDPTGWAGGSVPVGKVVTIKGAGVAPTTTALPNFAGMTIMDGASLTIANGGTISAITLADSAALTVSSGALTIGSALTIQPSGNFLPSVTVASGATLNVPGGTTFTDCSLSVSGTLAATTAGDLVLGTAAAGATSSFGLTVNGGTLSTSAGDIRFFCPASGGTVTPLGPVAFTGATFTHDNDHGFFFGVNNPATTAISFTFDGTQLNFPKRGYYKISGGSALRFVNGGSLWRDNNQNEKFTLTVDGLASIYLGPGTTSLIGESSNSGGSVGNGAMSFNPDTDGFVALTLDGAVWETYHSAGNGKAVVEVFGSSVHTINQNNYNRAQPFDGTREVHLNSSARLTISNNVDVAAMSFTKKFTGSGSLFFSTPRSTTRTFNFNSTDSTATGTLSADATRPTALVLASTATWGGTVIWNEKASINHSATADAMTFGGIDLVSDFVWRIWGDGTCDHYTLTGEGFLNNGGKAVITVADGSEANPDDMWTLARVPVGSTIPTLASSSWTLTAQPVDGDNGVVDLVLAPVSTDFTFNSTTVTDLSTATGWSCGYVPANENVKIAGEGVVAIISDAATFPSFASIAVRNGATLRVLANVTLPPLTLDSTAKVVIGDNQTTLTAVLNAQLVTAYNTSVTPVAIPIIEVTTNATLSVASGMKFKNVDFRLYGTVTKSSASTSEPAPVFGYAENGETSYLAFTADGGRFDFHANNNSPDYGAVSIIFPSSGGTVIPVGTITLRNASRPVSGWADFGNWEFCRNNPTNTPVDILVDGTHMDVSGYFYASGAAHLTLVNGSRIQRQLDCLGHWFPMAIQDSATITVEEGSFLDFTTNDGSFGIDSQVAVDTVIVRNGGAYTVSQNSSGWQRGYFVADDGILGVTKLSSRAHTDLLQGFAGARLDGDLTIASLNMGTGSADWNRHVKMTDKPFSGTGDVVVSNGVPDYPFSVTIRNGASTATGSIGVVPIEGADTALYFADGANWAGTVKANGDVRLVSSFAEVTNSAAAPAPVTVSFGGVQLLDNAFKLRLWQNGSCDTINIGANGWTGNGKLDFEFVDFSDAGSQTWKVATQPAGTALPAVKKATFALSTQPSATEGLVDVYLKVANGIAILLR